MLSAFQSDKQNVQVFSLEQNTFKGRDNNGASLRPNGHPHFVNPITKVFPNTPESSPGIKSGRPVRARCSPNPSRTSRESYQGVLFGHNSRSKPHHFTFFFYYFYIFKIIWRINNQLIINYKQAFLSFQQ